MHDPGADKLRRVKGEIEQVKTAMIQNLGGFFLLISQSPIILFS
jgi:hypothetical protein